MKSVTKEYKKYLKEDFMNTSYQSSVFLGAINQKAQDNTSASADVTKYSNLDIFNNRQPAVNYATCEKKRVKVNGSFSFLPDRNYEWSGIVSNELSDGEGNILFSITVQSLLSMPISIKGLTLEFAEAVPIDFDILTKEKETLLEVRGNERLIYESDVVYEFKNEIIIRILKIDKPMHRVRLLDMKFGIGLNFDTKNIISLTYKESLQLISTELFNADLTIEIYNENQKYDLENPNSELNFLEQQQKLEAYTSLLLPSGAIQSIKIGTMYLSEWSAKIEKVTFKATDIFNFLGDDYRNGRYYENGISLYDLANDVLDDAEIDERDRKIDSYLKTVVIYNPMPIVSHKEALQLIANAGRCILKQDNDGKILLKSSFVPEMNIASDDQMNYSSLVNVLEGTFKEKYATFETDISEAGRVYFAPDKDTVQIDTGYVSKSISNEEGVFANAPKVTVKFEAPFNIFNIKLLFGNKISSVKLELKKEEVVVQELLFENIDSTTFDIDESLQECDQISFYFLKTTNSYNRVYLNAISFSNVTDKFFRYEDLAKGTLKGIRLENISRLDIIRTIYTFEEIEPYEIKVTKYAGDEKETWIEFQEPMKQAEIYENENKIISTQNAWGTILNLDVPTTGSVEHTLICKGTKMIEKQQTRSLPIKASGIVKTIENPLISEAEHVNETGLWFVEYLRSDREYEFSYLHGDPSLETNDIVTQENKFVDEMQTQIFYHELKFAGSVSGKIKTRKINGVVK